MRKLADHFNVPWKVVDALVVFGLAWIGLPLLIIIVLAQLGPVLPVAHAFVNNLQNNDVYANFDLTLIDALAALALVGWYLRRYNVGWQMAGWRKFSLLKALGLVGVM